MRAKQVRVGHSSVQKTKRPLSSFFASRPSHPCTLSRTKADHPGSLLRPLGQYRQKYLVPSKGKRAKRRRRARQWKESAASQGGTVPQAAALPTLAKPPPPELTSFVDVGLRTITQTLASLATPDKPPIQRDSGEGQQPHQSTSCRPPYAAIFLFRAGHASAFHAHFPQMVAVASTSLTSAVQPGNKSQPIRLVGLSAQRAIDRVTESLALGPSARVSAVAVREGAPLAGPLLEIVRERVGPLNARWLGHGMDMTVYRPLVVEAVETKAGVIRRGTTKDTGGGRGG